MRYRNAIEDSLVIEDNELLPLVTLRPGDPMVRYDETGTKVLLLNVHCHPETFKPQTEGYLIFHLWTFTDLEFLAWLEARGIKYHGANWAVRLNQLLGMPATRYSTHVSGFWVKPESVIRPAYSFDVFNPIPTPSFSATLDLYRALRAHHSKQEQGASAAPQDTSTQASKPGQIGAQEPGTKQDAELEPGTPQDAAPEQGSVQDAELEPDFALEQDWDAVLRQAQAHGAQYRRWFDHQALIAYGRQDGYPWTRIGYTYDWGNAQPDDSRSKYGVSEFMIPLGTKVEVAFTLSVNDFMAAALKTVQTGCSDAPCYIAGQNAR